MAIIDQPAMATMYIDVLAQTHTEWWIIVNTLFAGAAVQ